MQVGDIIGHEGTGIVESVGPAVKNIKVGNRVAISAVIACGDCEYCQAGKYSLCDCTNPSEEMEHIYGYKIAALFGYSHLTGGYAGLHAEYARVPFADVNCMQLPRDKSITEEQAALLSDTGCTGFHATQLANVHKGDKVVVHGAGPIGLLATYYSIFRGAQPVVTIDGLDYRCDVAKQIGSTPLNYLKLPEDRTVAAEITEKLIPGGPDCDLDCVGFRFPKKQTDILHTVARTLGLETDTVDVVAEAIHLTKKGGRISLIGDYFGVMYKHNLLELPELRSS
jgi:threonine dehydrogenase-like Zn-dependent dehydrogenase